jgi:hypothetical protein
VASADAADTRWGCQPGPSSQVGGTQEAEAARPQVQHGLVAHIERDFSRVTLVLFAFIILLQSE